MPLIIVCGLPARGKTTRSLELQSALTLRGHRVRVVNDESLGIVKRTAYADTTEEEKKARGALLSGVERYLSAEDVVIADGLNYIKGFRYQLYCMAKALATPHAVVEVAADRARALEWNRSRGPTADAAADAKDEPGCYSDKTMDELEMRYEPPNSMTRWDKPLFVVHTDDALPVDAIAAALFGGAAAKVTPNLATIPQPLSDANYLFELDQTTQSVVNAIMSAQQLGGGSVSVPIPGASRSFTSAATKPLTWAELHRHRRQFVTLNKQRAKLHSGTAIADSFVDYLQSMLGR